MLPPSPTVLLSRIDAKRRVASRLHLVEPAVAWLSAALGARDRPRHRLDLVWAYSADTTLWGIAPPDGQQLVVDAISVGMLAAGRSARLLVALLAAGATAGGHPAPRHRVGHRVLPAPDRPSVRPALLRRAGRARDRRPPQPLAAHGGSPGGARRAQHGRRAGHLDDRAARERRHHPLDCSEGRAADLRRAAAPLLRPDAARAARPRGAGHAPARIAAAGCCRRIRGGRTSPRIARIDAEPPETAPRGARGRSHQRLARARAGRPAEPTRCDG